METPRPHGAAVRVVVPAHNEETVIGDTLSSLLAHFTDVVVVDDGSHDDTSRVARSAGATVVRHPVNLGQGAALQTGFEYALADAGVDFVVTFDADGQHRAADAARMVEHAMEEGLDVVLGSRFLTGGEGVPTSRRLILKAAVIFSRATTGLKLSDAHNGLRVLSRRALPHLDITLDGMAHASQLLDQISGAGLTYDEVPVTIDYTAYSRAHGQSNLNALNILFDVMVDRLRSRR